MFNNPMYYNNPYYFPNANTNGLARKGFFSGLFNHHFNWTNILNNTQKTLNVINQAIPAYYQIKPIYNNAKTMLRMVNALKDDTSDATSNNMQNNDNNKKNTSKNEPVFFL